MASVPLASDVGRGAVVGFCLFQGCALVRGGKGHGKKESVSRQGHKPCISDKQRQERIVASTTARRVHHRTSRPPLHVAPTTAPFESSRARRRARTTAEARRRPARVAGPGTAAAAVTLAAAVQTRAWPQASVLHWTALLSAACSACRAGGNGSRQRGPEAASDTEGTARGLRRCVDAGRGGGRGCKGGL